jgi:hypothetical protein
MISRHWLAALSACACSAAAAAPSVDQFGLACATGTNTMHFTVDLTRSLFCSTQACDTFRGDVEATPDQLLLYRRLPDSPRPDSTIIISRRTGEFALRVGSYSGSSGTCEREDYTPIPENKF